MRSTRARKFAARSIETRLSVVMLQTGPLAKLAVSRAPSLHFACREVFSPLIP
jgi:hypothetical protein